MTLSAPITALTMVGLLPIYVGLAFRVIKMRRQFRIPIGMGSQSELEAAIRAHGNFSEYVPFFLMLSLVAEVNGAPTWLIAICSILMITGRLIHSVAIPAGNLKQRVIGMQLTFVSMISAAFTNLVPFVLASL